MIILTDKDINLTNGQVKDFLTALQDNADTKKKVAEGILSENKPATMEMLEKNYCQMNESVSVEVVIKFLDGISKKLLSSPEMSDTTKSFIADNSENKALVDLLKTMQIGKEEGHELGFWKGMVVGIVVTLVTGISVWRALKD